MKCILVPCGAGYATSTLVSTKLRAELSKRHIEATVRAVQFKELKNLVATADLIVSIAPYDKTDYGIPTVTGVPFLTGVGVEQTMTEIEKALKGGKPR